MTGEKDAENVLAPEAAQGRFRRPQEPGKGEDCDLQRERCGCSAPALLVSEYPSKCTEVYCYGNRNEKSESYGAYQAP